MQEVQGVPLYHARHYKVVGRLLNFRSNRNTKFKCDLFLHWFLRAFALLRWFTSPLKLIIEIIQILRSYKPPDFDIFKPKNVRDGACVPESNISMVY